MKSLLLPISLAAVLCQCDREPQDDFSNYVHEYRQNLAAAATPEEWSERVKIDAEKHTLELTHLYAELPAKAEWSKAFALADKNLQPRHRGAASVFRLLLEEDDSSLAALQTLIKSSQNSYSKDESLQLLYTFHKDTQTAKSWILAERPDLLNPSEASSYTSSPDKKEPWDIALANSETDKAIDLLWKSTQGLSTSDKLRRLNKILRVSKLIGNQENTVKSAKAIEEIALTPSKKDNLYLSIFDEWTDLLIEQKQWDTLSEFVKCQLTASSRDNNKESYLSFQLWISGHTSPPADFATELEQHVASEQLSARNLYNLLQETHAKGDSLGILYSKALTKLGRHDDAWSVAAHCVALQSSEDKAYAYARSLNAEKFTALLDQLRAFDPFEERPLIWQSQLALDAGNPELAKTLIDQAIALDPSDGDQGKNSRMQAYAVLARIFEAQGNEEKANFFDEVVVAIRSGEAADDYLHAGLTNEAIERYQKSLGHFNDAYCLQSRLALTLARNDRFEEAIPHFEKAFNLMPVSFGPRESHCFGCEGLFSDERVHGIAKRILGAFVEKNPENPRAPYLLGLVYNEMKQYDAAAEAFQKALEIDPNYYNAADRLISALNKKPENAHRVQAIVKQTIPIAPYSNLDELFSQRSDLAQAWTDAGNYTKSPIDLGNLPLKPAAITKQYAPSYSWNSGSGVDGWTRDELLRDNEIVDALKSF